MEGFREGAMHRCRYLGIEGLREGRSDVQIEGTMERCKEEKMEGLRDGGIAGGIED